jgi:beta-lactamase regulating signal transducer with metallopeptidase domain
MLVLPLLNLLLPAILLPVLPAWEKASSASAPSVDRQRAVFGVAPYEWEPGAPRTALPLPTERTIPATALRVGWPAVIAGVYVVGVVSLFGRLLFGLVGCRRLVRGGRTLEPVHLLSGCSAARGAVLRRHRLLVLVCPAVRTPVTVGCLRSRILLPRDWSDWSDSKREAALAHELAHVERRDALFAALAALNRCLYWFHPLAWLLPRRLARHSEQACDDRAITLTGAPIPYARHLLEFAGSMVGQRRRVMLGVLSMSDGSDLRARIEAVLDRSRARSAPLARGARLLLVVLALVVVPAIAALRVGPRALGSAGTPTQNDPPARPANGQTVARPEPTYIEVRTVVSAGVPQTIPPFRIVNGGLKYHELDRLMAAVTTVTRAVPIRMFSWQIRHPGHDIECHVVATTHDYAAVTGLKMDRGRFLTEADNAAAQNRVVIGSDVAQALFPEQDPVGKSVKVLTDDYTVVGVTKHTDDCNIDIYMSLMTCKLRFGERIVSYRSGTLEAVEMQLSRLILEVREGADVEATAALVKSTLEPDHPKGDVEVVILKSDRKTK